MNFTAERGAFLAALETATRVIERKITIPIIGNVQITAEAGKGTLEITGTDLDIRVTAKAVADIKTGGTLTVPAADLRVIVQKMPDGATVSCTFDEKSSRLVVKSGRSRFQLPILPADIFPGWGQPPGGFRANFELPVATLAEIFDQLKFAISNEDVRFYLNGIYMHAVSNELVFVATDGHKLAKRTMTLPENGAGASDNEGRGSIISRKTVAELVRLAKIATVANFTLSVCQHQIVVTAGPVTVSAKLVQGTFPDYVRVIPTANDKIIICDATELTGAIDRVAALTGEGSRAVKMEISAGQVALSTATPDGKTASEQITAEYDGEPLTTGYNSAYLLAVMTACNSDTVQLMLGDPGGPALITPRQGSPLLIVVMPMRT